MQTVAARYPNSIETPFLVYLAQHRDYHLNVASRILQGRWDCEDAVQEASLKALCALQDEALAVRQYTAWFAQILRNVCLQWLRVEGAHASRQVELSQDHPAPSQEEACLSRCALYDTLRRLSPTDAALLVEAYVQEWHQKEMADRHGMSYAGMRMRLQRACRSAKREYEQLGAPL